MVEGQLIIGKSRLIETTMKKCDMVWEGVQNCILCMKSGKITYYSIDGVDLGMTFGETDGKEIKERFERIKRQESYNE